MFQPRTGRWYHIVDVQGKARGKHEETEGRLLTIYIKFKEIIKSGRKFSIFYVDPPWDYDSVWGNGTVVNHYKTMTLDDIMALDVPKISRKNAHLYLWYTNPFVREAHALCDAWGFKYRQTITWVKTTSKGKPRMGLGYYYRGTTEHLLFATKGHIKKKRSDILNMKEAPAIYEKLGRHSEKPEVFRRMIEAYSGRLSSLEMFGRKETRGWSVFGRDPVLVRAARRKKRRA